MVSAMTDGSPWPSSAPESASSDSDSLPCSVPLLDSVSQSSPVPSHQVEPAWESPHASSLRQVRTGFSSTAQSHEAPELVKQLACAMRGELADSTCGLRADVGVVGQLCRCCLNSILALSSLCRLSFLCGFLYRLDSLGLHVQEALSYDCIITRSLARIPSTAPKTTFKLCAI